MLVFLPTSGAQPSYTGLHGRCNSQDHSWPRPMHPALAPLGVPVQLSYPSQLPEHLSLGRSHSTHWQSRKELYARNSGPKCLTQCLTKDPGSLEKHKVSLSSQAVYSIALWSGLIESRSRYLSLNPFLFFTPSGLTGQPSSNGLQIIKLHYFISILLN